MKSEAIALHGGQTIDQDTLCRAVPVCRIIQEQQSAPLEGGTAVPALASGNPPITDTIIDICTHGDEIVAANYLYGGTCTQFDSNLPQFGINVGFADQADPHKFTAAITEKTRAICGQSLVNPALNVIDFEKFSNFHPECELSHYYRNCHQH